MLGRYEKEELVKDNSLVKIIDRFKSSVTLERLYQIRSFEITHDPLLADVRVRLLRSFTNASNMETLERNFEI